MSATAVDTRFAPGTLVWAPRDPISRRRPQGRVRRNRGHRALVEWITGPRIGHSWIDSADLISVF